jgi:hypothetical protein
MEVFWQRPFFSPPSRSLPGGEKNSLLFSWKGAHRLGIVYIPIEYPYFYTLDIGAISWQNKKIGGAIC